MFLASLFHYLLFRISPTSSLHLSLILVIALQIYFKRFRQRQEIDSLFIKYLQAFCSGGVRPVNAKDFDAMTAGRYVEVPIPDA